MMHSIEREVVGFAMPGLGIPGFAAHASAIAKAGVYDLAIHHEQILVPMLLRHWQIDKLEGLDAEAEQSRERRDGPSDEERTRRPPARRAPRGAGRSRRRRPRQRLTGLCPRADVTSTQIADADAAE